jgi:hypothetical protein
MFAAMSRPEEALAGYQARYQCAAEICEGFDRLRLKGQRLRNQLVDGSGISLLKPQHVE